MIVVIADDFSGAAEIAGVAHRIGFTAEVQTDRLRESSCEVIVVDANTRSLPPTSAADINARLCESVRRFQPELCFKKIDSVLRGAIVAEMEACARALGLTRCLLVNANPERGRVVRDGRLLIDGRPIDQTVFANDPEHPRRSASVAELLGASETRLQVVDPRQVSSGRLPESTICLANVESTADLQACATATHQSVFTAGGAEFFRAVLAARYPDRGDKADQPLRWQTGTLLVCGTSLRGENLTSLPIAPKRFIEVAEHSEQRCVELACQQLAEYGGAVLTVASRPRRNVETATWHQKLVDVACCVLSKRAPQHLWIEGGHTASRIVRALGWQTLATEVVYAAGVVALRHAQSTAPSLLVKPGSYVWPVASPRRGSGPEANCL